MHDDWMMPPPPRFLASSLLPWQHGEIIESSYLLGDTGPKSTWTRIFEMMVLLATVGVCAYLTVFLFHNGNHHSPTDDSPSQPHPPVGASSASMDDAACLNHPKCKCESRWCIGFVPGPPCGAVAAATSIAVHANVYVDVRCLMRAAAYECNC